MTTTFNFTAATEPEELLNTSAYDQITTALNTENPIGNVIEGALRSMFGSFYDIGMFVMLGWIFYLMWQDQRSAVLPAVVLVLIGGLLFTLIPSAFVMYVKAFAIMAMAGIVVKMYMDRR